MKTCSDFGPDYDCCEACHQFDELEIIRRVDGLPFAQVCCKKIPDVMAALDREESISK